MILNFSSIYRTILLVFLLLAVTGIFMGGKYFLSERPVPYRAVSVQELGGYEMYHELDVLEHFFGQPFRLHLVNTARLAVESLAGLVLAIFNSILAVIDGKLQDEGPPNANFFNFFRRPHLASLVL